MSRARGLSPGGATSAPAVGGAETHRSSLTQPGGHCLGSASMPRPAVKEARRSVHTRLWRAGSRRVGAFEGSGGEAPAAPPPPRGHVTLGKSLRRVAPQFPHH